MYLTGDLAPQYCSQRDNYRSAAIYIATDNLTLRLLVKCLEPFMLFKIPSFYAFEHCSKIEFVMVKIIFSI